MFTIVRHASTWRSLGLLVAGTALGATLVAPVAARVSGPDGTAPATTYTRSVSCAGREFYPADSQSGYTYNESLRQAYSLGPDHVYQCDPGLPSGAVVTTVQFTVLDNISNGEVTDCALVRSGLTAAGAATLDTMASVPSTGVAQMPGTVRKTDASILFANVNNTQFVYWLECSISNDLLGLGIYGANVIFTISAANG